MELDLFTLPNPWEGLSAHISRPNGKIKRCIIRKWGLHKLGINMIVEFQKNGKSYHISESPISLAHYSFRWHHNFVVSDSDEDPCETDTTDTFRVDAPLAILPKIEFQENDLKWLPTELRDTLLWTIEQVNNALSERE